MAVHLYNKCFSKTKLFNLTYSINLSIKHNCSKENVSFNKLFERVLPAMTGWIESI